MSVSTTAQTANAASNCHSPTCTNRATHGKMYCDGCSQELNMFVTGRSSPPQPPITHPHPETVHSIRSEQQVGRRTSDPRMSEKYPKYYKPIPAGMTDIDIYALCMIFQMQDSSGALHHAIKKILLPGIRTGGKTRRDDIKEARDTLTRWLELHP